MILRMINKIPTFLLLFGFFLIDVVACKSESNKPNVVIQDDMDNLQIDEVDSEEIVATTQEVNKTEGEVQKTETPVTPAPNKTTTVTSPNKAETKPAQQGPKLTIGKIEQKGVEVIEAKEKNNADTGKSALTITTVKVGVPETPKVETPKEKEVVAPAAADVHKHEILQSLLSAHVSGTGVVDYKALKAKEAQLDEYLKLLSDNTPAASWSRDQKLAYWINAYNAFTIKVILKNYPLKSIKDLSGGKIWDSKWITLGTTKYSLNYIENTIVRPQFKDPRIHFALNCGAKSCPPLDNTAYLPSNVQTLLEQNAKAFVRNKAMNDITASKVVVSSIFDWYGKDFGSIPEFLTKYSGVTVSQNAKIEFKTYDWSLNGK